MQESGKDYVLQTYLDQLPDVPPDGLSVSPKSRRSANKDESAAAARHAGSRLPSDQVQVAMKTKSTIILDTKYTIYISISSPTPFILSISFQIYRHHWWVLLVNLLKPN